MNNEIELNDIADELLILNKFTIETLFSLDNCADCIALYVFYYKTAKWQKTDTIKASDTYVKKSLKWGNSKIQKTKQTLKENGLIDIVQRRKDGKICGWYIRISYLVAQRKMDEISIKVEESKNSQNQQVVKSTSSNEETNALKYTIKCLKKEIEMLKDNSYGEKTQKHKSKKFVKPTIEEVKAYCDERNNGIDPNKFIDYYEARGWMLGKNHIKDWKACVRTWERNSYGNTTRQNKTNNDSKEVSYYDSNGNFDYDAYCKANGYND